MKLTYRGVSYEPQNSALDLDVLDQVGTYRGQSIQFRYPRHIPVPTHIHDLMYRGVAYRNDGTRPTVPTAVKPAPMRSLDLTRSTALWSTRAELLTMAHRIHRDNLLQRLNHRIEVARAQGNESLLAQLEEERHQTQLA